MTRELTDKQVQACENAVGKTCHCRCGGAFHGRAAGGTNADGSIDRAYFENLPDDDPHHMLTSEEKRAQANARKEAKKREKEIARVKRELAWNKAYGLSSAYYEQRLAELENDERR